MATIRTKQLDPFTLPATGSWPQTRHQFDENSIWAIKAAVAAQRPLLVRGEPGTGKSQLARAAAHLLKRAFISEVVHARSECHDLQYHYDAVARLGEAQTLGVMGQIDDEIYARLDPARFVTPGALWWTFNWAHAEAQYETGNKTARQPEKPQGWRPKDGTVLLIDEIDKADADLPNGLLETMGNGAFSVPYLDAPVRMESGHAIPLVVITTNEERELPEAFMRRCMVLHLKLPQNADKLKTWLCERGKIHFGDACSTKVRMEAADQLVKERTEAKNRHLPVPGQAEYLDILRAVIELAEGKTDEQLKVLKAIRDFALHKHSDG